MPFSGPQGQGPFSGHSDCVESMEDEEGITDPDALCAVWERNAADTDEAERFEELSKARLMKAAAENPDLVSLPDSKAEGEADGKPLAAQKEVAASNLDIIGPAHPTQQIGQKEVNELDPENLPAEHKQAVEADDFIIYGKASIEKYDIEDQRITVDALEQALDRFFESEDAPGIISRGHADVPVGRPIREHELEEDTTLVIDGEEYSFEAGDSLRTEAKDADDDQLPELWLISRLANDSELARETRLAALEGELNGYSVTVYPKEVEATQRGEDVTKLDLHAVTVGSDEAIKNKGSEFDVAEFKAVLDRAQNKPGELAGTLKRRFSTLTTDPDEKGVLGRLLQRAGEDLEEEAQSSESESEAEQKADEGGGAENDDADADADTKADTDDDDEDEDEEGGDGEERKSHPIDMALENDTISASEASELRPMAEKMSDGAVETLVEAVGDGGLDVEQAATLMQAMDDGDHDDDDDDVEVNVEDDDDDETDEAEEKASAREVAEDMADRFDLPVDEVMEHLDQLDMAADPEKDDENELKAAALTEIVDERLEEKLDERLPEDTLSESDLDQKLDDVVEQLDEEVLTKAEFDDLVQKADVVGSPTPRDDNGSGGSKTLAETLGVGGD